MDTKELSKILADNNVNESSCLIKPKVCPEGALCITKLDDNMWAVTCNERGEYRVNEKFSNEHEASMFFLRKVLSDPTYKKDFKPSDLLDFAEKKYILFKKYNL